MFGFRFGRKTKRIKELEAQVADLENENTKLSIKVGILQLKADAYDKILQRAKEQEYKKRSEAAKKAAATRKAAKTKTKENA